MPLHLLSYQLCTLGGAQLVTRSLSGWLARESSWFTCDLRVLFIPVYAGVWSEQFTILSTVKAEQTEKGQISADDECLKNGAIFFHVILLWKRGKAAK